jgi:four helix bundle protein
MKNQKYDLEQRLMEFAARIIKVAESLPPTKVGNHIADQLLRSGTSPYPNHGEAQAAESSRDFIHKIRIALKELRETSRWLKLIKYIKLLNKSERLDGLIDETEQLIKIFVTSVKTANDKK